MKKYMNGTLANGLKYIYIPDPNIMTFTLIVAFKVGSRDEKDDAFGYSHLLEHMLFKGTTRRPKAKDISQEFELLGGSFNATTSQCITNYYIKAPDENLEKCMDLLFDITFNSVIRSVDLEMEKNVVVEEFNKMMDSPMATCVELGIKEVFENHPLGQSVIGTKESILGFDRDKVYEYYKHFYTPSNCVVSIAGNIGNISESKLKKILQKYTNVCKGKDSKSGKSKLCHNITSEFQNPKQSIPLKMQETPKLEVQKRDNTQQCAIMIGYPSADRYNMNDIYALSIAASVLGGGLSSRLFIEVREKAGLAYTITAGNIFFQDAGLFMITTAIEKSSLLFSNMDENKIDVTNTSDIHDRGIKSDSVISKAKPNKKGGLAIILKVMEDILRDGITTDELMRSKTNIVNKLAMSYENTHTIAIYYNEMLMMEHSPIVTINDFIKGIKSVKMKQVNEVIQKYLSFEKMTICVVGNYTKKQIVEYLSKQF
jgi:predicted Zn-dependent peptidase